LKLLVDAGNDPIPDTLTIPLPILAIFLATFLFISKLSVYEQYPKVNNVEIGEDHAPTS
jgi:hypothetical protein